MDLSRISFVVALASASLWTAKSVAIGVAGGLDRSPLEGPLFLAGFLCHVLALVSLVLWWTRGRQVVVRALACAGTVAVGFLVTGGLQALLGAIEPADPGWVWSELNLWIATVILLPLTWHATRSSAGEPVDRRAQATGLGVA